MAVQPVINREATRRSLWPTTTVAETLESITLIDLTYFDNASGRFVVELGVASSSSVAPHRDISSNNHRVGERGDKK